MGVGQIFANVDEFRGAVYKYSSAHNFPYYYVKNDKKKLIMECQAPGCEWKLTVYSVDKNSFLFVRRFKNECTFFLTTVWFPTIRGAISLLQLLSMS